MNSGNFLAAIKSGKTLVLDGATGTNLQARGLDKGKSGEAWVLEKPEQIIALHHEFITAGSNIILTCTFNGNHFRLQHLGLEDQEKAINQIAVSLAKEAVGDNKIFVAGSIGPTGQMLKPFGSLDPDEAKAAFASQAKILDQANVDLLVVETQFDIGEAVAAVNGVRSVSGLPLIVSFSYDRGLRTMMGVKPAQAAGELEALGVDGIGINCGRSLDENMKVLAELRSVTSLPVWFKPNAGLPHLDNTGLTVYDVTPEMMGGKAGEWIAAGANMIGGCCGTTPEHLAKIAQNAVNYSLKK
jgi:5-methyltetrahydrofolate--homocysteine methyltransferase